MRLARIAAGLALLVGCTSFQSMGSRRRSSSLENSRAMAIGGETSGWSIQFDSETIIDGKPLHSLEVTSSDPKILDSLAN